MEKKVITGGKAAAAGVLKDDVDGSSEDDIDGDSAADEEEDDADEDLEAPPTPTPSFTKQLTEFTRMYGEFLWIADAILLNLVISTLQSQGLSISNLLELLQQAARAERTPPEVD